MEKPGIWSHSDPLGAQVAVMMSSGSRGHFGQGEGDVLF